VRCDGNVVPTQAIKLDADPIDKSITRVISTRVVPRFVGRAGPGRAPYPHRVRRAYLLELGPHVAPSINVLLWVAPTLRTAPWVPVAVHFVRKAQEKRLAVSLRLTRKVVDHLILRAVQYRGQRVNAAVFQVRFPDDMRLHAHGFPDVDLT